MIPRREEFFQDIRRAVRFEQKPIITTDSELIKADPIADAMRVGARSVSWLTPKIIQKYDASDFSTFPEDMQQRLRDAVNEFGLLAREVVQSGLARIPLTRGLDAFQKLVASVREVVLSEWIQAAEKLVVETESWALELGWQTRRKDKKFSEKKIEETLLGSYQLMQFQFFAEQDLYVLDPIARFVPNAMGTFDLSIQPSFSETSLYRDFDGIWYVSLSIREGLLSNHREVWTKESFQKSVEELRSLV
jgi:hypothetical protein